MDEFIYIHKGGSEPILRNCGNDATWFFENLQCIASVPDHFEGMLNMCAGAIVGVIKNGNEDPCRAGAPNPWVPPTYPYPDFDSCDVFDNITCPDLALLGNNGPNNGKWTAAMVSGAQGANYNVDDHCAVGADASQCNVDHCYTILHNWVFDLGVPPLDGSDPFYKKHGNGWYPRDILKWCGKDMTVAFEATKDRPDGFCTPDHTLGGMNVLSGYVVGVLQGSDVDPCEYPPDSKCTTNANNGLVRYADNSWMNEQGCPVMVLDKVYDLAEFKPKHWGGESDIKCGEDLTFDCKFSFILWQHVCDFCVC